MIHKLKFHLALALGASLIALVAGASAQTVAVSAAGLADVLAERPDGAPAVDTALVFSNVGNADALVAMKAWNHRGEAVGSAEVKVPGNGLAYLFASEIAEEAGLEGFIGKVETRARGHVIGSAVLLGGPVTDLPAINRLLRNRVIPRPSALAARLTTRTSHTTFPVVATY